MTWPADESDYQSADNIFSAHADKKRDAVTDWMKRSNQINHGYGNAHQPSDIATWTTTTAGTQAAAYTASDLNLN